MTLAADLSAWDGKSAADILSLYHQHAASPSFINDLLSACSKPHLQSGATWLLKHHLEQGVSLDADIIEQLYAQLPLFESWQAKLHILQSIPFMPIPATQKNQVEAFLRSCLIDTNKFVRAWAYNGFHELSLQHPEYREESRQFLDMALRDEAPSVKARVRNILASQSN